MPFLKTPKKDFIINNNHLELTPEYLNEYLKHPKKITGTKICSLIGKDPFKTPFMEWCELTGLFKEKGDDIVLNAGTIVEDKVFNYTKDLFNCDWESFDAKERDFDEFSGKIPGVKKNDIFGGLTDGFPTTPQTPILEIKTASKNKWCWHKDPTKGDGLFVIRQPNNYPEIKEINGGYKKWYPNGTNNTMEIPVGYQYQLGLYCYLLNQPKGLFAVAFLDDKNYIDPNTFIANDKNIKFKPFKADLKAYEQEVITPLTKWYKEFVLTGKSPEITSQDKKWLIDKLGFYEYNKLKLKNKSL